MVSWEVVAFYTGPVLMLAVVTKLVSYPNFSPARRALSRLQRSAPRALGGRPAERPQGRPIEDIAHDARRLGRRLRVGQDGRSALRIGAIRRSYDDVLGEGCDALGLTHLLAVLPPDSPELDTERRRVEVFLIGAGMVLEDVY